MHVDAVLFQLYLIIIAGGLFAEISFCLCLLIYGVNVQRWKAQAAEVASP